MTTFFVGLSCLLFGIYAGWMFWGYREPEERICTAKTDEQDRGLLTPESMAALKAALENDSLDFAVSRGPRHIPWSRRKKELEAGARQKRRHLESFTEKA